jgi:hypothetical protein
MFKGGAAQRDPLFVFPMQAQWYVFGADVIITRLAPNVLRASAELECVLP